MKRIIIIYTSSNAKIWISYIFYVIITLTNISLLCLIVTSIGFSYINVAFKSGESILSTVVIVNFIYVVWVKSVRSLVC